MTPETWEKINEIFNDAAELEPERRSAFLHDSCPSPEIRAEVEKLLASESGMEGFLDEPAIDLVSVKVPENIGRYSIVSQLGRGGMGAVYLGKRPDLGQMVAVKIIKKGLDSPNIIRRFNHERSILAALEHPNIARLIDGGTTEDGSPFIVMEYVEGLPIDEYCRELSLDGKLQLFRQVCKAVAFAHTHLIVHRDLKPSNIIVNRDGTVKLLDFGIAKLISDDDLGGQGTATSMGMMTPNYASPEQIRGEQVTTATDIYSLGVVLHQLLTGVLPHDFADKPLDKIFETLAKEITVKPSDNPRAVFRDTRLRGDLDNIVLKALRTEPERRYQSANDLSEDIRRYLSGLTVSARPSTLRYRWAKFVRRNKTAVAGASLVVLSLITGFIGIAYQYSVANRQRALAEKRFADVRELANKVVFRYHDEIAKFPGTTALQEELVQDAVKYLDSLNAEEIDDKRLKLELAQAYLKIGDVQGRPYTANLGRSEDALASYQKSIEILEKAVERSPDDIDLKRQLVTVYLRFVAVRKRLGNNDIEPVERALDLQTKINSIDAAKPVENALQLADVYITLGDFRGDELVNRIEIYKKALALLEAIPDRSAEIQHDITRVSQRLGTNYVWLGDQFATSGDKDKAAENYRLGLPHNQKMFESATLEIEIGGITQNLERILAGSHQNLGENHIKLGEKEIGLDYLQRGLEITLKLAKADEKNTEAQLDVAGSYVSFADAYESVGEFPKAVEAYKKALDIFAKLNLIDGKNIEVSVGMFKQNFKLVSLLEKTGRTAEAKTYRERNVELCKIEAVRSYCVQFGLIN